MSALNEAIAVFETLKKDFNAAKPDLEKCGVHLSKLKVLLTKMSFLIPGEKTDSKSVLLTREILELGAQWSIKSKDIPSFERYVTQLKTYYSDFSASLPESQRMYPIIGLNLLRLLAQNQIAEFHTELESLDPEQLSSNIYIRHPVQIEQCLMEGSYNKVWNSRSNVPAEEYLFFIDILMGTIRNEIASCSEKVYPSLPLSDATTLLYFKTESEVLAFAKEREWKVVNKKIVFTSTDSETAEIPAQLLIAQAFGYARELERIGRALYYTLSDPFQFNPIIP